jgi:predicted lipoprotein with Yx(FWY)xxD motif
MRRLGAVLVGTGLLLAGCGGGGDESSSPSQTPVGTGGAGTTPANLPQPTTRPKGETLKVSTSDQYGKILIDGKGLTLYLFTKETGTKADCYGECASAWPPFLTEGEPRAGSGVQADGLGTTKRTDGAIQVTYKGHPLYHYRGETKPGQILCQDVDEFGGTWLIVAPDGSPIH